MILQRRSNTASSWGVMTDTSERRSATRTSQLSQVFFHSIVITFIIPCPVYFDTQNVTSPRTRSAIAPSSVLKGDAGIWCHHCDSKQP